MPPPPLLPEDDELVAGEVPRKGKRNGDGLRDVLPDLRREAARRRDERGENVDHTRVQTEADGAHDDELHELPAVLGVPASKGPIFVPKIAVHDRDREADRVKEDDKRAAIYPA